MSSGLFTAWLIDTTPGGVGPFAPPKGWSGTGEQYKSSILKRSQRWDFKLAINTCLKAEAYHPYEYQGPYAEDAKTVICELRRDFGFTHKSLTEMALKHA